MRARAPPPRGIGKRPRKDSPKSTRERFALPTHHTLPRGQPLWQIVLRAYHGARAALYARFLDQPHPCGGCGCSQVHSSRRQALARGLHRVYTRLHLLLIVGRATRRRSARLSAAAALSRKRAAAIATTRTPCARALHHKGHRGKRARDDSPTSGERQRLCTSDSRFSFGVSSFDRSCRERGTAHTGGFASVFVGPAVPMRRLWVQSSAYHAAGRPCARPTGVRTASTSRHRPSATSRRASLRRRSRTHLATPDTTRRPCACARARRDVDNRASADLAMSTGTAAA